MESSVRRSAGRSLKQPSKNANVRDKGIVKCSGVNVSTLIWENQRSRTKMSQSADTNKELKKKASVSGVVQIYTV